MAVLTLTEQLTSMEVAKRLNGPNADCRLIIEELARLDELLLDAPLVPANKGTIHSTVVRTALPHGEHRGYNEGVGKASSQTKTIDDVISNIEIFSEVDAQLIDEAGYDTENHKAELLMSEQSAFFEGLSQDMGDDIMYGNHDADPHYTNGFAHRLNKINGETVIDMGGTGNSLTSIYLIKWATNKAHLIYPKGHKTFGVEVENLGRVVCKDANGKEFMGYKTHYRIARGLAVRNSKSVIRLANIDKTASNIGEKIAEYIAKNIDNLANGDGTITIACNPVIKGILNWTANQKSNVIYPAKDPYGNDLLQIGEGRIRKCPSILMTESQVV